VTGVRKKEAELVVVSKTPKQPTSGGWNKVPNVVLYFPVPGGLCFVLVC